MLNLNIHDRTKAGFELAISTLGVPGFLRPTKPPGNPVNAMMGMRTAGPKDEWIVNAFGINTVIFTLAKKDFDVAPERFDRVVINGVNYTADAVHPVNLNGTLLGWKLYCKGTS